MIKLKRNLIFWLWNDVPEPAEIRRQIKEFRRQKIDGFFIHAMPVEFRPADFPGGMPGYLSEEFFRMVGAAIECAAELDMAAWLYDEGGWPSGSVNKRIPREYPELRMKVILPDGSINVLETVPDILNPATTQVFISMVHEEYKKRFSAHFGKTIPGIFTDEPFFGRFIPNADSGSLPWNELLDETFRKVKGYEAGEAAKRIFACNDPQARQDYCEIWHKLMIEGYLLPISRWCHENNLLFTGHFNGDDCISNMELLMASDIFTPLSILDMPGCDAIWRQIHPLLPETDFPRITSSAARGKPVISESFAVYGADLTIAEMKQVAAMQFICGVSMIAPMALHYSTRGGRQVVTDSNFFLPDPRWEFYHCFCDFNRRMSGVLDRAVPIVKAHVPFPLTALRRGEYKGELFPDALKLAARQITYDYVPDAPEITGEITPDIRLESPCPALRTRHLKSPRGERIILANAGLETLKFRFTAPAGFNCWYDPSTGKHSAARADENNRLYCELPFAGTMVLLTIPGRAQNMVAAGTVPVTRPVDFKFDKPVRAVAATGNGLAEAPLPAEISADFCGVSRFSAKIKLDAPARVKLVLPQARKSAVELLVNGKSVAQCAWGPYSWEFTLPGGESLLSADISTTAEPAFCSAQHSAYLKANNYYNVYHDRCMNFEKLFPDEKPLDGAVLEIGQ